LGWPTELLLDPTLNDYGNPRGLAAALDPNDAIIAVRRECTMIRENRFHLLKFPRG
jgi:hypothetical protein